MSLMAALTMVYWISVILGLDRLPVKPERLPYVAKRGKRIEDAILKWWRR